MLSASLDNQFGAVWGRLAPAVDSGQDLRTHKPRVQCCVLSLEVG